LQRPKKDEKDLRIQQLERELARAGVDMRSITAEQVTANEELLIGNALKFSSPDNPPHIKIDSRIAKGYTLAHKDLLPDKEYCQITVEDNGIGFKPEYGGQIFEVFKRLHGKEVYPGTGIGLATVRRIVENHDGSISVDSKLDQGARFDIYIPVR